MTVDKPLSNGLVTLFFTVFNDECLSSDFLADIVVLFCAVLLYKASVCDPFEA